MENIEGLEELCSGKQAQEAPGTVIAADKGGIQVACGQKVLVLHEVQLEGKNAWKRMRSFGDIS